MTGTDTLWNEYTRTSAGSCNYALVPSILIEPVMSAATFAFWADSGSIIRDTLDTCTVAVTKDGASMTYTVDMQRGVVVSMIVYSTLGSAVHQYFYGYGKGIHFLTRVTFGYDTTIQSSGGYDFFNVRINGEQFTPVVKYPDPRQRQTENGGRSGPVLITGPASAVYDLLGRRGVLATGGLNQACRAGRCVSGKYLFKPEKKEAARSTVISR